MNLSQRQGFIQRSKSKRVQVEGVYQFTFVDTL